MAFPFALGMLLHRLHVERRFPRATMSFWAIAMVLLLSFMPDLWIRGNAVYDLAVVGIVYPAIIILSCQHQPSGRWMRAIGLSGALSYPLYMVHFPLLAWLDLPLSRSGLPDLAKLVVAAILICSASFLICRYYDEPLRARLRARRTPGI